MSEDSTDIEIPEDTKPPRLRPADGPVKSFDPGNDPDDVSKVDSKIALFRLDCPNGVVKTEIVATVGEPGATRYTVRASVWRDYANGKPADSTAHATRQEGIGDAITAAYPQETAETVALGRALRYLAYGIPVDTKEPGDGSA